MRRSNLKSADRTAALHRYAVALAAAATAVLLTGCHMDMWVQPKVRPYQPSDVFADGVSMRPLVPHTVDRTHFWSDTGRYTGYVKGQLVTTLPVQMTRADLERGQERFNIFCSPCHGALGNGKGMIAIRGLALRRQPATYHTDRLRKMPIGHFYDVITNGYGVMFSYASRVEPDDRWRIAAYIRVLQRSQHANASDLPPGTDIGNLPVSAPQTSAGAPETTPAAGTQFPAGTAPDSRGVAPQAPPAAQPAPAGTQPLKGNGSSANER